MEKSPNLPDLLKPPEGGFFDLTTKNGMRDYLVLARRMFEDLELRAAPIYQRLEESEQRDTARRVAFLGQKLATYIYRLIDSIDGSQTQHDDAQHWIDVISRDNFVVIDTLYGAGKGNEFRQNMINLGTDCLRFAASDKKIETPRRNINTPELPASIRLGAIS